jgi:hypothetical protein
MTSASLLLIADALLLRRPARSSARFLPTVFFKSSLKSLFVCSSTEKRKFSTSPSFAASSSRTALSRQILLPVLRRLPESQYRPPNNRQKLEAMSVSEVELDLRVEKQWNGNVDPGECDEHEIAAGKTTARRPGAKPNFK